LDAWRSQAIEGWTEAEPPWYTFAETLGAQTAPLVGAAPEEVIVANSTTVNLHQLLATLYDPHDRRTALLTDATAFPSDLYALRSHLRLRGRDPVADLRLVPSRDGLTLDEEEIIAALTAEVQLAVLPAVIYTSGQLLDMRRIAHEARRRGIRIGFDCSHSIGAVPHELSAWEVDFAFWCSYKYLNGGPGASGGLYLNRRHWGGEPGLAGWFSSRKDRQFDLATELTPAPNAGAMQIGTPNILSMAPLQGTLELHCEAGMERLRRKSLALTRFLLDLAMTELAGLNVTTQTPLDEARRGGHIALRHPEAARVCKALRAHGVVPDFRPPDIIRLAPVPLYTRFLDCYEAIARLRAILMGREYETYEAGRDLVP
jgi:kynureninase